nr:hypothetical protein [Paracoccus yeei]
MNDPKASIACSARASSAWPDCVSVTEEVVRDSSRTCNSSSSAFSWPLTAGWVMCRASAALVTLESCATVTKVRSWRMSMRSSGAVGMLPRPA